jgi:hypothetical protein
MQYFVARDFSQYLEVLAEYEATMQHQRPEDGEARALPVAAKGGVGRA